jgi:NAD(P)-dependent dehydrogenase (short-subunit alcohol dehydrogenase family)
MHLSVILILLCTLLLACSARQPRFAGKSVLVTGGSSGIGKAVAKAFAAECADTIHIVARAQGQLEAAKKEIEQVDRSDCASLTSNGPLSPRRSSNIVNVTVVTHAVDVSDIAQVRNMMSSIDELHIGVNSAGIGGYGGNLNEVPDDIWFGPFDAVHNNVYATMFATLAEVDFFLKKNVSNAAIVNLASGQGLSGCQGCAMYSASKHAVIGITQSVALEVAAQGIRVNAVAPGLIETPLTWNQARGLLDPPMQSYECIVDNKIVRANYTCDEGCVCGNISPSDPLVQEIRDGYNQLCPAKRTGLPEEVAMAVLHLASSESTYTTGSVYQIDGGFLAFA